MKHITTVIFSGNTNTTGGIIMNNVMEINTTDGKEILD